MNWIKVENQLPPKKDSVSYLGCDKRGDIFFFTVFEELDNEFGINYIYDVDYSCEPTDFYERVIDNMTHWMPLPPKPEDTKNVDS